MLFFTIAIIVWWALATAGMDFFRKTVAQEERGDKLTVGEMLTSSCLILFISVPFILAELIYLLYALKYDEYLYPTYILLGLFIFNYVVMIIRNTINKIKNKKSKIKEKIGYCTYFTRIITAIYFGYMLWVVIS